MIDLKELEVFAVQNNVPIIRPKTLEKLLECVRTSNPQSILEIGTAIGYSGIKMLAESNANLTTIEKNPNSHNLAIQNFAKYGLLDRCECVLGDAGNVLTMLCEKNRKYDMIFLDGPKGQYIHYLPKLISLINPNGTIFADNVLFRGMVNGPEFVPHRNRTIVVNLREYLDTVSKPPFESKIYDIEDGFCISKMIK